ncbi:MAG: DUF721 domain-containing protein [Streptomycetaceae bacterium]|nr:DUF721 domain-containing protein [Streptomycetaceae bacterium]
MTPSPSAPVPRGADLARTALRAAVAAARQRPQESGIRRASAARTRTDGREPVALDTAIGGLLAAHAWELPAAGGGLLERWPSIAPDLAPHVAAVGFDAPTGRLDLRPSSSAYATNLRIMTRALVDRVNTAVGSSLVRDIRVLAPARPRTAPPTSPPASEAGAGTSAPRPRTSPAGRRTPEAPQRLTRTWAREPEWDTPPEVPADTAALRYARAVARARRERAERTQSS